MYTPAIETHGDAFTQGTRRHTDTDVELGNTRSPQSPISLGPPRRSLALGIIERDTILQRNEANNSAAQSVDEEHISRINPPELPPLRASGGRTKLKFKIGIVIIVLDLAVLPVAYFYAFRFGAKLELQELFGILTGIFGMLCFAHYAWRSLRLFMHRTGRRYRPLGWTRWGLAEFLHTNIACIIFCFECELVIGTIPNHPWVRLCAMTSATICYYIGFLFIGSAIFSRLGWRLPFNMSSIPKGEAWRPALFPVIEDFGALEMSGERAFRRQLLMRYEASEHFRDMLMTLTWVWGVFFLCIAAGTTVTIMLLPEDIAFGVGWGMPWLCALPMALATVVYVRRSLRIERAEWRKKYLNGSEVSESVSR